MSEVFNANSDDSVEDLRLKKEATLLNIQEDIKMLGSKKNSLASALRDDRVRLMVYLDNDKYSVQGQIDMSELFKFAKDNKELLTPENYQKFQQMMGVKEAFPKEKISKLKLFNSEVSIVNPENPSSDYDIAIEKIIEQLEKRKEDFSLFITSETLFIAKDGARLEFSIEKEGKTFTYSATPDGVFLMTGVKYDYRKDATKPEVEYEMLDELTNKKINLSFKLLTSQSEEEQRDIEKNRIGNYVYKIGEDKFIHYDNFNKVCVKDVFVEKEKEIRYYNYIKISEIIKNGDVTIMKDYRNNKLLKEFQFDVNGNSLESHFSQNGQLLYKNTKLKNKLVKIESYKNGKIHTIQSINSEGKKTDAVLTKSGKNAQLSYEDPSQTQSIKSGSDYIEYDDSGKIISQFKYNEELDTYDTFIVGRNGVKIYSLNKMKKLHPEISNADLYMTYISKQLNEERFNQFLNLMVEYTFDEDNEKLNPNNKLSKLLGLAADYTPSPKEMIENIDLKTGRIIDDCDGYAELAKEYWRLNGENSQSIYIPRHAFALNIKQNDKGFYVATTMGTFGLDINGNRAGYPILSNGAQRMYDKNKKGFKTIKEAINAVLAKYEKGGLGLKSGLPIVLGEGQEKILVMSRYDEHKNSNFIMSPISIDLLMNNEKVDKILKNEYLKYTRGEREKFIKINKKNQ